MAERPGRRDDDEAVLGGKVHRFLSVSQIDRVDHRHELAEGGRRGLRQPRTALTLPFTAGFRLLGEAYVHGWYGQGTVSTPTARRQSPVHH